MDLLTPSATMALPNQEHASDWLKQKEIRSFLGRRYPCEWGDLRRLCSTCVGNRDVPCSLLSCQSSFRNPQFSETLTQKPSQNSSLSISSSKSNVLDSDLGYSHEAVPPELNTGSCDTSTQRLKPCYAESKEPTTKRVLGLVGGDAV